LAGLKAFIWSQSVHARLTPGFHSSYPFAGIMIGQINALTAEVVCPLTPTGTILPEISRFYRLPTAVTTSDIYS
jgi:hypothetical protein